jgi:hypothetical protein
MAVSCVSQCTHMHVAHSTASALVLRRVALQSQLRSTAWCSGQHLLHHMTYAWYGVGSPAFYLLLLRTGMPQRPDPGDIMSGSSVLRRGTVSAKAARVAALRVCHGPDVLEACPQGRSGSALLGTCAAAGSK